MPLAYRSGVKSCGGLENRDEHQRAKTTRKLDSTLSPLLTDITELLQMIHWCRSMSLLRSWLCGTFLTRPLHHHLLHPCYDCIMEVTTHYQRRAGMSASLRGGGCRSTRWRGTVSGTHICSFKIAPATAKGTKATPKKAMPTGLLTTLEPAGLATKAACRAAGAIGRREQGCRWAQIKLNTPTQACTCEAWSTCQGRDCKCARCGSSSVTRARAEAHTTLRLSPRRNVSEEVKPMLPTCAARARATTNHAAQYFRSRGLGCCAGFTGCKGVT